MSGEDRSAALAELRRTPAGIELYAPDVAEGPLPTALEATERMVLVRVEDGGREAVAEAERNCDASLSTLRQVMREDLHRELPGSSPRDQRRQ